MGETTSIGDSIAVVILLIGVVLFVISFKDVKIYAPNIFWWGLALIVASGVYFAAKSKGWSGFT